MAIFRYLIALAVSDTMYLVFSFSMAWKHYDFMKSVRLYWNYIPLGLWITDALSKYYQSECEILTIVSSEILSPMTDRHCQSFHMRDCQTVNSDKFPTTIPLSHAFR